MTTTTGTGLDHATSTGQTCILDYRKQPTTYILNAISPDGISPSHLLNQDIEDFYTDKVLHKPKEKIQAIHRIVKFKSKECVDKSKLNDIDDRNNCNKEESY